jgi:hypothetical protein
MISERLQYERTWRFLRDNQSGTIRVPELTIVEFRRRATEGLLFGVSARKGENWYPPCVSASS